MYCNFDWNGKLTKKIKSIIESVENLEPFVGKLAGFTITSMRPWPHKNGIPTEQENT